MKINLFHSGNLIIIGFTCCALAMIYLAYLTTTVQYDMVVDGDYYKKEIQVNELHVAQNNAAELGEGFKLYETNDSIVLSLPPRFTNDLSEGRIYFYCLSNAANDVELELLPSSDGHYSFNKNQVMKGKNYKVKVSFNSQGKMYFKEAVM